MTEKTRRSGSVNRIVLDILRRASALAPDATLENDLAALQVTGARRTCRDSRPTPGCSSRSTRRSGADGHLDISGYTHLRRSVPEAGQTVTRAKSVVVPAIVLWVVDALETIVAEARRKHTVVEVIQFEQVAA